MSVTGLLAAASVTKQWTSSPDGTTAPTGNRWSLVGAPVAELYTSPTLLAPTNNSALVSRAAALPAKAIPLMILGLPDCCHTVFDAKSYPTTATAAATLTCPKIIHLPLVKLPVYTLH